MAWVVKSAVIRHVIQYPGFSTPVFKKEKDMTVSQDDREIMREGLKKPLPHCFALLL